MRWLDNVRQDLRHGARLLRRSPAFTAVAVLSIAFGTGANVAMFSTTDALLLRPLPVERGEGLYTIGMKTSRGPLAVSQMSHADFVDVRERSRTLQSWVAYDTDKSGVGLTADAPRVRLVTAVSGNFFDELGVPLVLGRGLRPAEDRVPGRDAVTVISYGLWQSLFNGDRAVVGRQVRIGGHRFTVVGVTAASFHGMYQLHIPDESFVPLAMSREVFRSVDGSDRLTDRGHRTATVKARLRPGVSIGEARAELHIIGRELQRAHPGTNEHQDVVAQTEVQARITQNELQAGVLLILNILAVSVLCVACANVAGLLTSRAPLRQRELAVRAAIGAGRGRILTQLLTESLILAVLGGAGGIAVGQAGIRLLRQIQFPTDFIAPPAFVLDQRAMIFSLLVAIVSALLFGFGPALTSSRVDLTGAMRVTEYAWLRRWRPGSRSSLTAVQVALSLMLLTIAALTWQTFALMFDTGPGFRISGMAKVDVEASQAGYAGARSVRLYEEVLAATRQLPGVTSASVTSAMPLFGLDGVEAVFDRPAVVAERAQSLIASVVDEDYFRTMDVPMLAGRPFAVTDDADAPLVAIVNDTMAAHFWPRLQAVGQRFRVVDERGPFVEVVGVVTTSMYVYPAERPQDMVYLPFRQHPRADMTILAQTAGPSSGPLPGMREILRALDPSVPVYDAQTIEGFYRARATGLGSVVMALVGSIGLMGVTITLVGLYGLVSYAVNRRTREIGIRIAVGASYGRVLRMLLRHGLTPVWVGLAAGAVLSVFAARLLLTVVETSAVFSPLILAAIVPALVVVTLLAAYLPARRAASLDPTVALRCD